MVSPSLKTANDDPFACLPSHKFESDLAVDLLERFVDEVSESGKCVLLSLDDMVDDTRKHTGVNKALVKILYNRRHITADYAKTQMTALKESKKGTRQIAF